MRKAVVVISVLLVLTFIFEIRAGEQSGVFLGAAETVSRKVFNGEKLHKSRPEVWRGETPDGEVVFLYHYRRDKQVIIMPYPWTD